MKRFGLFLATIVFLHGFDYDSVPLLKWAGPPGSRPETYEEWLTEHPYTHFSYSLINIAYGDGRQGTVAIITEQSIAPSLANEVNQLVNNMQLEGYTILNYQMSGSTPESLRIFLYNQYNTNNLEGALLIGNLPVAWYEVADDFGVYGYADFPCDLYFMDLNGTWLDTMDTGNGKYDGHTGDIVPEIYVSRLYPNGLGSDTLLLKNYFRKNNAYRHDTLALIRRALVFVDDDWVPYAPQWAQHVSRLYPDTMNFWHPETTRASIYRAKLDSIQAWVSVFAHSWPGGHMFYYNSGGSYDYYYANEYTSQNPATNFYNFFCCSFSRYTASGNCGGSRAIFNQDFGIGSIGSTKTGSMLDFYYFYNPLGQGKTLGEAFKDWFTHITSDGVTFDELCWHYGMTLLGDCYLKPVGHAAPVAEYKTTAISDNELTTLGNPVSKHIRIKFSLNNPERVTISLYDCLGNKVKNLLHRRITHGDHVFSWLLTATDGNELPEGMYFLRMTIGDKTSVKKFVKL